MVARQAAHFAITDEGDFERASAFIRKHAGSQISIEIAPEAAVAVSPDAVRDLAEAARATGVDLELVTDDPLIRELARIYGIRLSGEPDAPTMVFRKAGHDQTTVVGRLVIVEDLPSAPESLPFNLPAAPEWGTEDLGQPESNGARRIFDDDASFSFVISPPVPRRPDVPVARPLAAPDHRGTPQASGRQSRRRRSFATVAFGALATVAAFAALLVGMLAPYASVRLVPATTSVSAELTYGLAGGPAPLDLTFQPEILSRTLTYSNSIQTTGERFVPDASAHGIVFITNSETSEAFIPAGTYLTSTIDGVGYLTEEDITVPASDPFGSATFGTAVVNVVASEPGPDFNLKINELSGALDPGILYRNRFPLEGGTLKRIAVVTEADVEQIRSDAETALLGQVATALDEQLDDGMTLVAGTLSPRPVETDFSHQAGADAETLEIEASMTVTGQAYNPDEWHAAARAELAGRLDRAAPEGYATLENRVQLAAPQPVQGGGPPAFRLKGEAAAEAVIDPARVERLREDLIGKDRQEAETMLSAVPGIERVDVQYGPDWLPIEPVPRLENRVTVEVDATGP